ncbi:hypothetical protein [Pseudoduganella sp. HUAS MS19]
MNKKTLNPDLKKKIGMVLGREIDSSESGNVSGFTDFSEADVEDFRALEKRSGILAVSYIRFRLAGNVDLNTVTSYYATVIQHGVPVEEWMKDS